MSYIKAKDKKELLSLLEIVEEEWNWKQFEKNNNSWGDCSVKYDSYVKLDEEWIKKATKLIGSLK